MKPSIFIRRMPRFTLPCPELLDRLDKCFISKAQHLISKAQHQKEIMNWKRWLKDCEKELSDLKYEPKKRWLEFKNISNVKNKTKTFEVWNKETDILLGDIKWDCGWRQYIFDDGELKLAEGCLYELFEKIKKLKEKNV